MPTKKGEHSSRSANKGMGTGDSSEPPDIPFECSLSPREIEEDEIVEALDSLHLQLQNKPAEGEKIQAPPGLQATLSDHQQQALVWMLWREQNPPSRYSPSGGILAVDMSLDMRTTIITLIMKSLENESLQKIGDSRKNLGGTLIVCPASLTHQWRHEVKKTGNISEVKVFHREKDRSISNLSQYKVVIISYDGLLSSYTHYKIPFKIHWRRVILDETHFIKNSDTRDSQCFAALIADKRWALTGTQIDNVKDIFPIVKFLRLQPFDDSRIFNEWIDNDAAGTARLHRILECVMLRRTRDGVIAAGFIPELLRNDEDAEGRTKKKGLRHPSSPDENVGRKLKNTRSNDGVKSTIQEENSHLKANKEEDVVARVIKNIQSDLERKPGDEVKVRGPQQLQVKLLDYQQHILACMLWRESCKPAGGILLAGMSIDRIIMIISLILESLEIESLQEHEDSREYPGGTLIVCPADSIREWKMEIENKGNISEVNVYHVKKEKDISVLGGYQIVITTYEELSGDDVLFEIHWRRVVLDNFHSESKFIAELLADKRWAVPAILSDNKEKNLFQILRFLQLEPFDDWRIFNKWITKDAAGNARLKGLRTCLTLSVMKNRLNGARLPSQLPRKTDRVIEVFMTPEESFFYDRVMDYSRTLFIEYVRQMNKGMQKSLGFFEKNYSAQLTPAKEEFLGRQGTVALHCIERLIMKLRQICCHPALLKNSLEKGCRGVGLKEMLNDLAKFDGEHQLLTMDNPVFNENTKLSKISAIVNLVEDIIENGEKVIIVSNWVSYLNLIGQHLKEIPGARYRLYTGNPNNALDHDFRRFNDPFDYIYQTMILMISLNAAGERLDLTEANHVIVADVHWDQQLETKALESVYRIEQTREVFIHKFMCRDTVEEKIIQLPKKNCLGVDDIVSLLDM